MPLDAPAFYAKDRAAWREWLKKNHATAQAVWLVYDKGALRTLHWADIVQEALCFGWIDSRPGKVSETQSKIYVSRRKKNSVWSKINKAHIEELLAKNFIMPAGLQAIAAAKANGSWDALTKSDNLEIPTELTALLEKNSAAKAHFTGFSAAAKRVILQWVYAAKTEVTRAKRIARTVELAAQGIKANQ